MSPEALDGKTNLFFNALVRVRDGPEFMEMIPGLIDREVARPHRATITNPRMDRAKRKHPTEDELYGLNLSFAYFDDAVIPETQRRGSKLTELSLFLSCFGLPDGDYQGLNGKQVVVYAFKSRTIAAIEVPHE
ncbi:MAG: hypothetical protein Q8R04_05440 [Nanoarchaeota archaeon]|nr:hypothetical protein [Nanoarchaeota archaeon]